MAAASLLEESCNHFLENHILVREDWLKEAIEYVHGQFPSHSGRRLYQLLFEQWLFSDLALSCYPVLDSIDPQAAILEVHQPLVLQITSLVDVGSSLLSQFNKLTYEFVDNSGFDVDPSMQKEDNLYQAKPSRCLMLTFSDGERELRGMERRNIPSLSLLTPPGCKIVLRPPLIVRKGVFLLNSSNIQLLGGDDPLLMETGRPLNVMAKTLEKEIPKKRDFSHLGAAPDEQTEEEMMIREFEEMDDQFDPSDFEPTPAPTVIPTTVAPPTVSPIVTPTVAVPTPRPLKRSIDALPSHLLTPTHSSTPLCPNTQSTSSPVQSQSIRSNPPSSTREVRVKLERVEVIDIDDDDPPASPSTSTPSQMSSPSSINERDPFIIAYRSLRLLTLEEAFTQSKFQSAPCKRRIEAFVDRFVEPLRIVEDIWTMKLQLKDGGSDGVECLVHCSILEKLIGLSVEEANMIKASTDQARKREGMSRLACTEETLSRLDLIWTVEFSPWKSKLTPVVRDVQTLAEILNAFD